MGLYSLDKTDKIVDSGVFTLAGYKDKIHWFIRTFGDFPTAYVEYLGEDTDKCSHELDSKLQEVHGGITYFNIGIPQHRGESNIAGRYFIGWDYAHSGDYICGDFFLSSTEDKMWELEEIRAEVIKECKAMMELYGEKEKTSNSIVSYLDEDKIKSFMKGLDNYIINAIKSLIPKNTNISKKIETKPKSKDLIPEGTSCLIKKDEQGVIFIAKRNNKSIKPSPNYVYITNTQRECFFQDLRDNEIKNNSKRQRYAIYRDTNPFLYNCYESLIDILYQKQKGGENV